MHGLPLHLITEVGPGLFPGELHEIAIRVRRSAGVAITGQSAVKIHAGTANAVARLRVEIEVEAGATLLYLPEPVVGYSGSRFDSATAIDVEEGGTAILGEIIGHPAPTQHFDAPPLLAATAAVSSGGELVLADRFSSLGDPISGPAEAWLRATGGGCIGFLYLCGVEPPSLETAASGPAEVLLARPVGGVSVVRVRAAAADRIQAIFQGLAGELLGAVPARH